MVNTYQVIQYSHLRISKWIDADKRAAESFFSTSSLEVRHSEK